MSATEQNRLDEEQSPYLRQHADNPVNWQPWDDDALDAARERDVPIFLSIGYSACHWCHVMEDESFEDEGVAERLNEEFVPI
ncbi:thioredoxin domain-containing protein, partial [Halobacteriales archaeon QH_9_66_26]